MQLAGDLTALSIVDLIHLLHTSDWEGTLRVRRDTETALFVLQGGLVLFPLPRPALAKGKRRRASQLKRRRKREELRGNRRMASVCKWTRGTFRCFDRQLPRGFVARRSLVVRVERLRKYCSLPTRSPGWGWESGVGLQGELLGSELPVLMGVLCAGHWSGVLRVDAPRAQLEILVHGKVSYVRRPPATERRFLIGPSETVRIRWKPRPVPEVGLRPERYMRASLGGRPPQQVA